AEVAPFDATTSPLLPPPAAPGGGPDAFARLPVDLAAPVAVADDPTLDDGSRSDSFDRLDQPLDGSSWRECTLTSCGPSLLQVRGDRVVKDAAGDALGARFPDGAAYAARPVDDLDVAVSASFDVSAAGADRAGLALRIESTDRFYLVEYRRSANAVTIAA